MRILIADDKRDIRSAIRLVLQYHHADWSVEEAAQVEEINEKINVQSPELLILDWDLPGLRERSMNQSKELKDLIREIRKSCPDIRILIIDSGPEHSGPAIDAGADAFFCKGDPPEQLLSAIRSLRRRP